MSKASRQRRYRVHRAPFKASQLHFFAPNLAYDPHQVATAFATAVNVSLKTTSEYGKDLLEKVRQRRNEPEAAGWDTETMTRPVPSRIVEAFDAAPDFAIIGRESSLGVEEARKIVRKGDFIYTDPNCTKVLGCASSDRAELELC